MSKEPVGNGVQAGQDQAWQSVLADMTATATEYQKQGWETLELHPGDAVLVDSEMRTGLDVVLPGPEYEQLATIAEQATFTDVEVFSREQGSTLYLLIVEQDPANEVAVFVPAYYDISSNQATLETIIEDGQLQLFCRRLNNDYVEVVHGDVAPFLPRALRPDEE